MDEAALRDEVMSGLLVFISSVVLHNVEAARQVGLGGSDAQFVGLLRRHGPLTPGRLAELSGLTTGTVTGVLDRLERGGFVRRERDTADRRRVLVVPDEAGTARLDAQYADYGTFTQAVLARRSPAELAVIAEFFRDLTAPAD